MAAETGTPLLVITGATAVGKTGAALALCRELGGEIVGADSVQVYRELDIGSCKPTLDQLGDIPHHMLNLIAPNEQLSAARYAQLADACIADVHARGKLPIVVGGTGLWLRALLRGLVDVPAVDPELRQDLERRWDATGAAAMHGELARTDPKAAAAIHPNDKLRVVRALEVYAQTGRPMGELRAEHQLGKPRYHAVGVHLELPASVWEQALQERTAGMFTRGWVDEVQALVQRHGAAAPALKSVGYRQLVEFVCDRTDLDSARTAVRKATRTYARRQRNWFRTDPGIDRRLTPAELCSREQQDWLRQQLAKLP